ncbi:MAG: DUF1998 domain-containing protein [Bacteroidetes bacterium]|jgi:hypothetical protein|nr:DUF1998 domain-containing protein [Bacteroidota bacterium]
MRILQEHQYNQGIGKYKLLSSTAGVGSIITTKFGTYVLVSDINKWQFINLLNNKIKLLLESSTTDIYNRIRFEAKNLGLSLVDDKRFVKFIQNEKELKNLECLIAIPQMALNEMFNSVNWTKKVHGRIEPAHPIALALNELTGSTGKAQDYQIQGTHFPKWFKNDKGELRTISDWLSLWRSKGNAINAFSPPRDANAPIKDSSGNQLSKTYIDSNNEQRIIPLYKELSQTNLILICPNGHLSDIPWSKYLTWKTKKETFQLPREDNGAKLFDFEPCCGNPNLKWTESKTKSEGYGSIYIECTNCGLGSGNSKEKPKITLEGINNLKPHCIGQKPWEIEPNNPNFIHFEKCHKNGDERNAREEMQVALVTANNTYYANGFSSLFVPMYLAENLTQALKKAIDTIKINLSKTSKTKDDYWEKKIKNDFEDYLRENDIYDESLTIEALEAEYFKLPTSSDDEDFHEQYRFQEYKCFSQNSSYEGLSENKGLSFKDITLNDELKQFFFKIQEVDELKVTNIQFDFTRVRPKERVAILRENGQKEIKESSVGKNIFSIKEEELFVLPANETFGEGLFFQFNDKEINNWIQLNKITLDERFKRFLNKEININQQGSSIMQKIKNNGVKHFLIHSFSHMMMRELEFSCGYPTASLKERLYISTNPEKQMSGLLIYTAEGSEGSMGGLVSQGEPAKILEIIKKGLERSINCSSDPLCWESDGQGIFDLNLSACFSCSLVSETACEELNLGLDRRVLVDEEFGYFKNLQS